MTGRAVHLATDGAEATQALAAIVADALRPGDVVALTGELGAGKTCFVKGACHALGVTEPVSSPTFVLRRDYAGRVPIIHLDVYRLDHLAEVADLGYEEIPDPARITFIEWGDAMAPLLPSDHLEVELRSSEVPPDEVVDPDRIDERRRLTLRPHGDDWLRRIVPLSAGLEPWRAG